MLHTSSSSKQKYSIPIEASVSLGTIHGLQERKFWIRPTRTVGSWM